MNFLREQGTKQLLLVRLLQGLLELRLVRNCLREILIQGLGSTYLNQYMSNLLDFSKLGLGAGGVLASSGAYSKGSGSGAKPGIAADLMKAVAAVAA
jgi:hypothetical protein